MELFMPSVQGCYIFHLLWLIKAHKMRDGHWLTHPPQNQIPESPIGHWVCVWRKLFTLVLPPLWRICLEQSILLLLSCLHFNIKICFAFFFGLFYRAHLKWSTCICRADWLEKNHFIVLGVWYFLQSAVGFTPMFSSGSDWVIQVIDASTKQGQNIFLMSRFQYNWVSLVDSGLPYWQYFA